MVNGNEKIIRSKQIELIHEFKRLCFKHNLTFYAMYGTLLGAYRHQGYIPWDDDIDFTMPRSDFEKLKSIPKEEYVEDFFLQTPNNEPDFYIGGAIRLRHCKTTGYEFIHFGHSFNAGIWIDITAIDSTSSSKIFQYIQLKMIRYYQRLKFASIYYCKKEGFLDMNHIQMLFYRALSKKYLADKINQKFDKWCRKYERKVTKKVAIFTQYCNYQQQVIDANIFRDVRVLPFENILLPCPVETKKCLEIIYGPEYMKLPDKNGRIKMHTGYFNTNLRESEFVNRFTNGYLSRKYKGIILFGTGKMFEEYMDKYGQEYMPIFAVDNNEENWNKKKMGIAIMSPDMLKNYNSDKFAIVICTAHFDTISDQLNDFGIHNYYVFIQNKEWIIDKLINMSM